MMSSTPLLQVFCLSLLKAARQWRRIADREVEDFGLSEATAYPLVVMAQSGDGLRQAALAEALGMEGPSLVRLLDQLCDAELVQRREDPTDKRAKTLHLTDRGRRVAKDLVRRLDRVRASVFDACSEDEIRATLKVLKMLERAAAVAPLPVEVAP